MVGAKKAFPGRQVISLSGDGGLSMLMGDLLTAVQEKIPIKIAVFNNGSLGFVELEMKVEGLLDTYTNLKKFCSCGGERQRALAGKSGDNDAAGTLS
jgi:pyruvate dehydrogenase (quinone)